MGVILYAVGSILICYLLWIGLRWIVVKIVE
jgi:hypothetical protein